MKDKAKIITGILMAMLVLLFVPQVFAVAGPGKVSLNCTYFSAPTDGAVLRTTNEYKTAGETYTTSPDGDLTFTILAMANSNSTNVTLSSVASVLYWDNTARATTNVIAGYTNDTGAINSTIVISNDSIGVTHSYYTRFYLYNHTSFDNITSCAADVTCTHYGVNDATLANITVMDCPTRTVSLMQGPISIACGDGRCNDGETLLNCPNDCGGTTQQQQQQDATNNNLYLYGGILIVILFLAYSKYKK